jgi:hypothetical protein
VGVGARTQQFYFDTRVVSFFSVFQTANYKRELFTFVAEMLAIYAIITTD